ncbi:family 16 glycosylhydrolase [Salegentibacter salegens]|uniref:Glycosyl hydrolases family 16 n=1 Tax=Salegentibacter salegens TaxID=143223 RepID=A0A1M7MH67_9FLAO|nr:family 16 glycosylhydrolase [Salegentibacter salegens]PRX48106.1 glycosyl hydrolase family 16 [Salegentibacter salegens]SHM89760.1 Glycosyl hydrolases family 16 [Salegentibacter salegens]
MKNIIKTSLAVLTLVFFSACSNDDYDIGDITTPSNLNVTANVVGQTEEMPNGDGSGAVSFSASADNAMTYKFIYGDGFEEVSASGETTHSFNENGVNDYTVTVIASGTGGASSNMTTTVTVFSDFSDPETKELLTGGSSKTWYVAASQPAHLGVGPSGGEGFTAPIYYAAAPFEKAGADVSSCFYTDELTFSLNENDNIVYNYNNNGLTFVNVAYTGDFGGDGSEDQCLDFSNTGDFSASLSPSTSGLPEDATTGTVINIAGGGTMSYYVGSSSYEVLNITPTTMDVRVIPGNDPALAWYLKFTTSQGGEEEEPEEFQTEYENLVWEQDFDTDGPVDSSIWNFEIGNNNGWGNQEAQYYTEDNALIEGGNLVITAKAEDTNEFDYSSSRITTKDNFEFQYGRVEARAKLPEGAGTWPAIWMLGSNFDEVGWPETGEIDIMEHVGNQQDIVHGTLHYPGRSGGNADGGSVEVPGVSDEFHTYTMEWSPERILFLVDGEVYHTYANNPDSPFNKDFFIILNVAMGGTFGGEIDPAFEESSMEIDYIRVYQE